ncbi:MAG: hypothetical protein ACLTWO_01805 [Blautia massiliensis (ex Durand et al. 2017)]
MIASLFGCFLSILRGLRGLLNHIEVVLDGLDCGLVLLHDLAVLLGGLRSGFGAFDSVLHLPNVPQGLVQLRAC